MRTTLRGTAAYLSFIALLTAIPARVSAQHEHHTAPAAAGMQAVTGTILCSEGPPLGDAIVQVYEGTGAARTLRSTALTDASGRFVVRMAPGNYTVSVTYLGHTPVERPLVVGSDAGTAIGAVQLPIAALAIDGIAVNVERERVQLRSGATVVDAKSQAASAGGTVADLLRTVPGVELDADGRIMLRGSTSVLVLLNGRRIPLEDEALAAFLRQMPASALERIEAGTSASARQDADGMGGVVNLVFRDEVPSALTWSAAASAGTSDHYLVSATVSGPAGPAFSWDAAYSLSSMRPQTEVLTSRENLLAADAIQFSEQASLARARHRLHSLTAGGTARITPDASLGLRLGYSWMQGAFRNSTDYADAAFDGATVVSRTRTLLEHTIPNADGSLLFDWTGRGARHLKVSAEARTSRGTEDFDGSHAYENGAVFLGAAMDSRRDEHVLQADVSLDALGMRLELGQKVQVRDMNVDYRTVRDGSAELHEFAYDETVAAAYVSGHGAVGSMQVQGGVRVERDPLLRVFPSLLVQWPRGDDAMLRYRASYGRRISRPDAAMLNPYSMGEDDMNAFVGNPALRPEVADQFELGIERHGMATTLQLTPFLRLTSDPIRALKAVTESGRATTTLQNLSRTRAIGADASGRIRIGDRTTATLSLSAYNMRTEGLSYRKEGTYVTARASLDVRVAERTSMQVYGYRRSAQAIEQGEILPAATSEFALVHRLGEDGNGRITVRVSDPFDTDRLAFHIAEPGFVQHSERRTTSRRASLFMSWSPGGVAREDAPPTERAPQIF